jgi:hypothetical protein
MLIAHVLATTAGVTSCGAAVLSAAAADVLGQSWQQLLQDRS